LKNDHEVFDLLEFMKMCGNLKWKTRDGDQRRGREKEEKRKREMGKKMGTTAVKKMICG
jgi:hypothetical protein